MKNFKTKDLLADSIDDINSDISDTEEENGDDENNEADKSKDNEPDSLSMQLKYPPLAGLNPRKT